MVSGGRPCVLFVLLFFLSSVFSVNAAGLADANALFFEGRYDECAALAKKEFERGVWNEKWPALLLRCQLTTGQYAEARRTYGKAVDRFSSSIGLRMLGQEVYRYENLPQLAERELDRVLNLARKAPWKYSSAADRITLGKFFLSKGEDARQVLELFYDRARKSNPKLPEVHIATAELAIEKHDYKVAADAVETAIALQPQNPLVHYLEARAWQESDPGRATKAIQKALAINEKHVASLLFQADHLVDAERYKLAGELLERVLEVNPFHPEAWAYQAVIAHLQGDEDREKELREKALQKWNTNPYVDHLIGKKLSQKYRFAEGSAYQRRALSKQPDLLMAKSQLSQDLLRLGQDDEGWRLAKEVHELDGYNVVAYNLITLRDHLSKFTTLEADNLQVRMDAREARIYGRQVLDLLIEARGQLCDKYDVTLDFPVTVEIFPQQQDFAIRTFGLPGGAGFLGVCFGPLITANSPASQGDNPSNWQSVLWHEFCHVVTLSKTKNKMPRWLSEGISVYEERQRNPSWGEQLTPQYREMVLGDDLTPVSSLSAAFLQPPSPAHLQFAYYESSLVVEYLIDRHGPETLNRILVDLGIGMPMNESLERYVASLEALDEEFAEYARDKVRKVAPQLDWKRYEIIEEMSAEQLAKWLQDKPNNYWGLIQYASKSIADGNFEAAEEKLIHLRQLYPEDVSLTNARSALARLYRQTENEDKERDVLEELAELDSSDSETYIRLMKLHEVREDWAAVRRNALRILAVNPMLPVGHEMLARAAERLELHSDVADALAASLEFDPVDPAGLHFRLARALLNDGHDEQSKRHVLMALEEAPRYRDAQRLLLELTANEESIEDEQQTAAPVPATETKIQSTVDVLTEGVTDDEI